VKIGLGAVQFGLSYGVSNKIGKTPKAEVKEILSLAKDFGIKVIDTAFQYGNSEEILGELLVKGDFNIVTKTPAFTHQTINVNDAEYLEKVYKQSVSYMGKHSLYGLLFHNADDLFLPGAKCLFEKVLELKENGLVDKIGVSIYSAAQIDKLIGNYPIDLIQLPINILDQRLLKNGYLSSLKSKGIEIHARSIFLQGLLLMDPETMPVYFDPIREHLKSYHQFIKEINITPVEAALGFVSSLAEVDVVLCGVNSKEQLVEICNSYSEKLNVTDFEKYAINNIEMLNPSKWKI